MLIMSGKGKGFPSSLYENSSKKKTVDSQQFSGANNVFQDLDLFPGVDNFNTGHHKIVKKQMSERDYENNFGKNVQWLEEKKTAPEEVCTERKFYPEEDAQTVPIEVEKKLNFDEYELFDSNFKRQKRSNVNATEECTKKLEENMLAQEKIKGFKIKKELPKAIEVKDSKEANDKEAPGCSYLLVPDDRDCHFFYECETQDDGLMKIRRKKCSDGEQFSKKYLQCLNNDDLKSLKRNKRKFFSLGRKKVIPHDPGTDSEPMNKWMDVSVTQSQTVPSEFKTPDEPHLKIYYLRSKRNTPPYHFKKKEKRTRTKLSNYDPQKWLHPMLKGNYEDQYYHQHFPRSYIIRKNSKESLKKSNMDGDNDNEENEEEDEEEEEDHDQDKDDESQDEKKFEDFKTHRKNGFKGLLKPAKDATISRVKLNEMNDYLQDREIFPKTTGNPNDRSEMASDNSESNKRILLDADIKVDNTISNLIKNLLTPSKKRVFESKAQQVAKGGSHSGGDDSELHYHPQYIRIPENMLKNNPRVKRFFITNLLHKKYGESTKEKEKIKDGNTAIKEGIVSIGRILNGMSSEFQKEELIHKMKKNPLGRQKRANSVLNN